MKNAEIQWQNDQPFSTEFDDIYFSRDGGLAETEYVFMQQNGLPERWRDRKNFVIAETGFGTGLNFLTTVLHWLKTTDEKACLHYISIEKFPLSKVDIEQALACWPELETVSGQLIENYPPAVKGFHHISLFNRRVVLTLVFDDAEESLPQIQANVDAWYLDGFAPGKNEDMWTAEIFKHIARTGTTGSRGKTGTTFSTFTAAGIVRRGLQKVGFDVGKVKGFGHKREMLCGVLTKKMQYPDAKYRSPWFDLPTYKPKSSNHAIVVGAGIAGITTACSLAKRGWTVDIIERNEAIAQAGSGNPLGIVLPRISIGDSAERAFYDAAFLKTLRELKRLKQQYPKLDWQQGGVLQLGSTERIKKQITRLDYAPELAQAMSAKSTSEVAGIEIDAEALYFPQAGWVNPAQLCRLLLKDAGDSVRLKSNSHVESIEVVDGKWELRDGKQTLIAESETVILANASAARFFTQTSFLPLNYARGQISIIPSTVSSQKLSCAICHDGYIIPESNGNHVIGASFITGDDCAELREEDDRENIRQLRKSLPDLFAGDISIVNHRAAVRATTPDRLPLIGPVADKKFFAENYHDLHKGRPAVKYASAKYLDGLYVNAGHGARGLTSAFLAAEVIASQLNDEPLAISSPVWQAVSPSRFTIRKYRKATNVVEKEGMTLLKNMKADDSAELNELLREGDLKNDAL